MRRLTILLFVLGLSGGAFLYRADIAQRTAPLLIQLGVADTVLEIQTKALSVNDAVQDKIKTTVEVFLPKTEETQNTSKTKTPESTKLNIPKTETPKTTTAQVAELTVAGVISETNRYRQQQGLPALSQNTQLTLSAQMKVNDMFVKQYFEHESPTGVGASDLAKSVGYTYLMVGENLALGDYESDFELVEGWMNSPGHRENILNPKYTNIGVAVRKGMFEGEMVWLAVQEFGRPSSDCPVVSATLNTQIETTEELLTELKQKLTDMAEDIERTKPKSGSVYEEKVDVYNDLVHKYNVYVEQSKRDVATYNAQVKAYNACAQE